MSNRKFTVLYSDDEIEEHMLYKHMVSKYTGPLDIDTKLFDSHEDLIEYTETNSDYDLIILDQRMGADKMNGTEAIEVLLKNPKMVEKKIILISGDDSGAEHISKWPGVDFVSKPFSLSKIIFSHAKLFFGL